MNPKALCSFLLATFLLLTVTIMPSVHANAEANADAIIGPCPKKPIGIVC
uniref:U6-myrmicitoxin-Mri1a n=1 Tax=Manica rubida TaxID=219785 RepID=TX06A_MANRB|nr:RecName: Full=U6-myrmicitoxin-Mri1a; Short=U6-MYRTX-Mri1a; Flags: Precursor [Manica rubida]QIQ51450.1 U6-MYRTX-Mri1a precursor [Manica rubida]